MTINSKRASHLIRGEQSEQKACDYLIQQGLCLVEKNFSCQYGEIDLIMKDSDILVIVEVRFRKSTHYGSALESITPKKQSRLIATAQLYLVTHKITSAVRFDVVTLSHAPEIHWIKNAFQT